jgi:hypothetical protein
MFGTFLAAALLLGGMAGLQPAHGEAPLAADHIGGTVLSARGAEAGVWVIAETHDFQTRFAKIVVTDEAGRYLLPGLPKAKYDSLSCGLDRPDRGRRAAGGTAGASERYRAQRGRNRVGLVGCQSVFTRPLGNRSPESDRQRQRHAVWHRGTEHG